MEIEINNKRKLRLIKQDHSIIVEEIDANGVVECRRRIEESEIVLLYDYYILKKENNEPIL